MTKWRVILTRVILFVAVLVSCPAVARADGIIDWLDKLSGPGPFRGVGASLAVLGVKGDGTVVPCLFLKGQKDIQQLVDVRFGFYSTGEQERFTDAPGDKRPVHALRLSASYLFRFHPSLDAGIGAGYMRFSGDGFDSLNRLMITPISLSFGPFEKADSRALRAIRIRFDEIYLTKGFNGTDFGHPTSHYSTDAEFIANVGVVYDWSRFRK